MEWYWQMLEESQRCLWPCTGKWSLSQFFGVLRSSLPIPWSHDTPPPNQRRPGAAFEPHTSDIIWHLTLGECAGQFWSSSELATHWKMAGWDLAPVQFRCEGTEGCCNVCQEKSTWKEFWIDRNRVLPSAITPKPGSEEWQQSSTTVALPYSTPSPNPNPEPARTMLRATGDSLGAIQPAGRLESAMDTSISEMSLAQQGINKDQQGINKAHISWLIGGGGCLNVIHSSPPVAASKVILLWCHCLHLLTLVPCVCSAAPCLRDVNPPSVSQAA